MTVDDITSEEGYLDPLLSAGYQLRVREPGHRMVRTSALDVHIHILESGDPAGSDYLLFRDHLRRDSARPRALRAHKAGTHSLRLGRHERLRGREDGGSQSDQGTGPKSDLSATPALRSTLDQRQPARLPIGNRDVMDAVLRDRESDRETSRVKSARRHFAPHSEALSTSRHHAVTNVCGQYS